MYSEPNPKTKTKSKKAKDWRPITQISLPGKILERITHTQISKYLEDNNLMYDNQHGFQPKKCTTSTVFSTLRKLYENWNMGLLSTCVFINFSCAFDSIDHDIFLKKLGLYGFSQNCIKFICSYMTSRIQCTIVERYKSGEA